MTGAPLELTVLGAGAALPGLGRGPAGYALRGGGLEGVTLLDCGPGSVRSLADRGLALLEVERVVVSHFHADHVLDLFALAFARRNPGLDGDALPELDLVGPTVLGRLLRAGEGPLGSWVRDPRHRVTEVDPAELTALRRGALLLDPGRARHNDEALSWRVVAPSGASLVYSGDTGETPALVELAGRDGGADLLVAECALELDQDPDRHLNAAAAGRAARDAGVRGLLLTHFYPHVDPARALAAAAEVYAGPIWAAVDGSRLRLRPGQAPELLA